MKETLLKAAAEIKKAAEDYEKEKMTKCAKVMKSAAAMFMLAKKIKS